jgi:hypothetical protein
MEEVEYVESDRVCVAFVEYGYDCLLEIGQWIGYDSYSDIKKQLYKDNEGKKSKYKAIYFRHRSCTIGDYESYKDMVMMFIHDGLDTLKDDEKTLDSIYTFLQCPHCHDITIAQYGTMFCELFGHPSYVITEKLCEEGVFIVDRCLLHGDELEQTNLFYYHEPIMWM